MAIKTERTGNCLNYLNEVRFGPASLRRLQIEYKGRILRETEIVRSANAELRESNEQRSAIYNFLA